jgi:hypothetical protein
VRRISLVEYGKSTRIDIVLVIVSLNQPVQILIPPASEVVGAAGITAAPTPAAPTPSPASTPMPATTTPAPGITNTPVPSSSPTSVQTSQPHHW